MTIISRTGLLAAFGSIAAAAFVAPPAEAQSIACGGTYTVQLGETLSMIAERAYGDDDYYLADGGRYRCVPD